MDFLNKSYVQVADLFRSMTPAARITSGLLLAAVVVGLAYLFNTRIAGGEAYLLSGHHFSPAEIDGMEAAFGTAGLGDYEIEGSRIRVPRASKAKYMAALADAGAMPAHFGSHLTEAVSKPSPFTSKHQQEGMEKIALQRTLTDIVSSMRGVERAAVLYDKKRETGFRREQSITASVSVKPIGTQLLDAAQVQNIRHLVAGAIAGLSPERVTVVDLNGRSYSGSKGDGMTGVMEDPYAERVQFYQDLYETMVREALNYVDGVTVTASVELSRELRHHEELQHVDPKVIALNVREENDSKQVDSGGPAGRPGLEAQRPNAPANLAGAKNSHTEEERNSSEVQNVASHDRTTKDYVGLTPKRVTVAVAVPDTYYEKIWRDLNPPAAGQAAAGPDKKALETIELAEKAKIQNQIAGLIPQPDTAADNRPLVTVNTFHPIARAELPAEAASGQAFAWLLAHWSTIGMLALAVVSLLMLRSIVRSGPPLPPAPELKLPDLGAKTPEAAAAEAEGKQKGRLKRRPGGQSLRDELVEIVREDPDTAANILRGWIGNAS
ncbi:MAG TPA: flagellar M-ring protein FliF C-terminal domain-containing protein [Pirellulales bacterium]|nr:flagellar M-ring protein FliF C-terminal domain-containing protein [Pirellulales bacterium]